VAVVETDKHYSLLRHKINYGRKNVIVQAPAMFTACPYIPWAWFHAVLTKHSNFFATLISYACKMFTKPTTGVIITKLSSVVSDEETK
jgi:hypothetical protein